MRDRAVNATQRLNAACRFAAMLAAANTAVVAAFALGTRLAPAAPKHRPQTAHRSLATAGLWADPVSAVIAGVAAIGRVAQPFVPVDFAATCAAGRLFGESGRTTTGTTLAAQKLQPGCKPRTLRYGLAESIHAATARADQRHRHDRQPTQIGPNHVTVLVTGKLRIRRTVHLATPSCPASPSLPLSASRRHRSPQVIGRKTGKIQRIATIRKVRQFAVTRVPLANAKPRRAKIQPIRTDPSRFEPPRTTSNQLHPT